MFLLSHDMQFGLQHPNFSFDYNGHDTSQMVDSLKNLVAKAENAGFDSFWVMDHFHQIPIVGKKEEPMLESWTNPVSSSWNNLKNKIGNTHDRHCI